MNTELECKLKINSRDEISNKLTKLGAKDLGDIKEKNWVFDTVEHKLKESHNLLRLRTTRKKSTITFKGKYEDSNFKKRLELESVVDSPENMMQIFSQLGYVKSWYYEKMRHTFELDNCEIVLDKMPNLGDFIEIEAKTEEDICRVLTKLELKTENHIDKSYLDLFAEYCGAKGEQLSDMKF